MDEALIGRLTKRGMAVTKLNETTTDRRHWVAVKDTHAQRKDAVDGCTLRRAVIHRQVQRGGGGAVCETVTQMER